MNERIRKLIRTKSAILFPGTDEVDCQITDIEKFAELIVLECGEVAYKAYWANPETVRGRHIEEKIRKHFGVDE